jgi:hypothetical protein
MVLVTQPAGLADEDFAIWSWQFRLCFFSWKNFANLLHRNWGKF